MAFDVMLELGNEEARNHSVGLSVWYQLITIALALMKNGAVVPVLVRHPELRSQPARLSGNRLSRRIPYGVLCLKAPRRLSRLVSG